LIYPKPGEMSVGNVYSTLPILPSSSKKNAEAVVIAKKTYNSGYSPVVTHLTTNPPVDCLSTAERTGSSVLSLLWSYVEELRGWGEYDVGGGGGVEVVVDERVRRKKRGSSNVEDQVNTASAGSIG
jgi:hypothetical protein